MKAHAALLCIALLLPTESASQSSRITVIVDAFGSTESGLAHDWGYAALVEYNGYRILFDTGNDSANFARNAATLGVDLTDLDAVVISHRHGDHTAGLAHVLALNPHVRIYAPSDEYFGGATPRAFFAQVDSSLPTEQRYFGGEVPGIVPHGTPWRGAAVVRVAHSDSIRPGIHVVANLAPAMPFAETPELSLVLETPEGLVVLVGCSHPGVERILASLPQSQRIHLLMGGLHLVTTATPEVDALAERLSARWRIDRIAPGHCTGEHVFAILRRRFGSGYVTAGIGSRIHLP